MSIFSNPAPQWTAPLGVSFLEIARVVLVLDVGGFYRFDEGVPPAAYFETDGGGITRIVTSSSTPMRVARVTSSGITRIY